MDTTSVAAMIERKGESVTVVRESGSNPPMPYSAPCRAMVRRFTPQELTGAVKQTDREVRVSPVGLRTRQWPEPIRNNDRVLIDGKQHTVMAVDEAKVADAVAFYTLQVRG